MHQVHFGLFGKKKLDLLKAQTSASFKGFDGYVNEMCFYVAEYNSRQRLKSLGFVDSLENLDALTGEAFAEISKHISDLEEKEAERSK